MKRMVKIASQKRKYKNEKHMVEELTALVVEKSSPVRCYDTTKEFDYSSGRADLVGLGTGSLIHAFEAKLTKWRQALHQARRNICFAHFSYVALPACAARRALNYRNEFQKHGVGLLILNHNEATLAIPPRENNPLLPWLTDCALSLMSQKPKKTR